MKNQTVTSLIANLESELELTQNTVRALCNEVRMKILLYIQKNGTTSVNAIYRNLKLEQSITSDHLRTLRLSGLVKDNRQGQKIVYSLDEENLIKAISLINTLADLYQSTVGKGYKELLVVGGASLSFQSAKKAQLMLKALDHEFRREIIEILGKNGNSDVTTIYLKLRVEQTVASQHLAVMRKAGLVACERDGKRQLYSINEVVFKKVISLIKEFDEM